MPSAVNMTKDDAFDVANGGNFLMLLRSVVERLKENIASGKDEQTISPPAKQLETSTSFGLQAPQAEQVRPVRGAEKEPKNSDGHD
jgi:hypothetical protein